MAILTVFKDGVQHTVVYSKIHNLIGSIYVTGKGERIDDKQTELDVLAAIQGDCEKRHVTVTSPRLRGGFKIEYARIGALVIVFQVRMVETNAITMLTLEQWAVLWPVLSVAMADLEDDDDV